MPVDVLPTNLVTLTDGATVAVDWNNGKVQTVTLGGNRTITLANPIAGGRYALLLVQDGTGSRTVTWPASVKWPGGAAPPLVTTGGLADMVILVYDGNNYQASVGSTSSSSSGGARENLVRNSGFWFAQRQAPGTLTTYSATAGRAISADGWGITNENASAQYVRTDTTTPESGLQGRYYGQFTKITSTGKLVVTQVLEGTDVLAIRGRAVRVQAWMKQIVGAAPVVRLGLIQLTSAGAIDTIPATYISAFGANGTDPTLGANLSYIAPLASVTPDNATINGNAVDCTLSASWQRFGAVFTVPSDCKNIVVSLWGSAQFAATNGFALAQVSLTDGYDVQAWTPLELPLEMTRVLRFYQKTFAINTAPAQSAGVTTGCLRCILGKAGATALAAQFQWRYVVNLRAAATTLTTYNPAAANAQVRQIGGTASDLTATATANSTEQSVDVTATGVGTGAVGDQCGVHVSADAEL